MKRMFAGFPTPTMTGDITNGMEVGMLIPTLAPWRAVQWALASARPSAVS